MEGLPEAAAAHARDHGYYAPIRVMPVAEAERLRRLMEVGRWLFSNLEPETVLNRLVEVARELTGARYAALGILENCHRAMTDGGKLLIVEGVYPPRIEHSLEGRRAAANDVNMRVNTGGRQRSEAEFRALYDWAGFALTRIVPTPAGVSIVEGVRE